MRDRRDQTVLSLLFGCLTCLLVTSDVNADGRVFVLNLRNSTGLQGFRDAERACAFEHARLASSAELRHAVVECSFSSCTRGWLYGGAVGTTVCNVMGSALKAVDVTTENATEDDTHLDAFCIKDKGVPCGDPPSFPNAHLQGHSGYEMGDELLYSCMPGYVMPSGLRAFSLLCDSCGEWYGRVEICVRDETESHIDYEDKFTDSYEEGDHQNKRPEEAHGQMYEEVHGAAYPGDKRSREQQEISFSVEESHQDQHGEHQVGREVTVEGAEEDGEEEERAAEDFIGHPMWEQDGRDDVTDDKAAPTEAPVSLLSQKHLFWFPSEAFQEEGQAVSTHPITEISQRASGVQSEESKENESQESYHHQNPMGPDDHDHEPDTYDDTDDRGDHDDGNHNDQDDHDSHQDEDDHDDQEKHYIPAQHDDLDRRGHHEKYDDHDDHYDMGEHEEERGHSRYGSQEYDDRDDTHDEHESYEDPEDVTEDDGDVDDHLQHPDSAVDHPDHDDHDDGEEHYDHEEDDNDHYTDPDDLDDLDDHHDPDDPDDLNDPDDNDDQHNPDDLNDPDDHDDLDDRGHDNHDSYEDHDSHEDVNGSHQHVILSIDRDKRQNITQKVEGGKATTDETWLDGYPVDAAEIENGDSPVESARPEDKGVVVKTDKPIQVEIHRPSPYTSLPEVHKSSTLEPMLEQGVLEEMWPAFVPTAAPSPGRSQPSDSPSDSYSQQPAPTRSWLGDLTEQPYMDQNPAPPAHNLPGERGEMEGEMGETICTGENCPPPTPPSQGPKVATIIVVVCVIAIAVLVGVWCYRRQQQKSSMYEMNGKGQSHSRPTQQIEMQQKV